jgi:hypothetical protein
MSWAWRNCSAPLGDLGTSNFAFVGSVAELLFQGSRVLRCNLNLSCLGRRCGFGRIRAVPHANPIGGEA